MADIDEAEARLARFAPYIARVFPETAAAGGVIESPLTAVPRMKGALAAARGPVSARPLRGEWDRSCICVGAGVLTRPRLPL